MLHTFLSNFNESVEIDFKPNQIDITTWIFPSWTSLISYRVFLWHTYPWLVMFSGKQIQRVSTGRKNVFIIRPENGAQWINPALKPTGQRSSSFVVDGQFGNLWIWGKRSCLSSGLTSTLFFRAKHPDLYESTWRLCIPQASVWVQFWRSRLRVPALVHILCGWQSVRSKRRQGATKSWAHCGSREAVCECECTKGTQDNKPLE